MNANQLVNLEPLRRASVALSTLLNFSTASIRHTLLLKSACGRRSNQNLSPSSLMELTCFSSLAEVASINLCTCFPVVPRFIQLILSKAHGSQDPESHPSSLGVKTNSSGRRAPFGLNESYDAEVWTRGRDHLSPLKSTYLPLERQDHRQQHRWNTSVAHNRIQRTVSIELTRRD